MSSEPGAQAALRRVLAQAGDPELADRLAHGLEGADLTTLLLEVMRGRAGEITAARLMRRYREDRFVAPGEVSFWRLRAAEGALLSALAEDVEPVVLAPVAPLGASSSVGPVDQNNLVSTVRMSEVAVDPTNALGTRGGCAQAQDHLRR
jgi:hypothetical protein